MWKPSNSAWMKIREYQEMVRDEEHKLTVKHTRPEHLVAGGKVEPLPDMDAQSEEG